MTRIKQRVLNLLNSRRLWIVAGGIIAFFILVNYVILPAYVRQGAKLGVPVLTGMTLDEARILLDSLHLQAVDAGSRPDPRAPVGTVVAQNPEGGAVVKEGRRVYLTTSGGEILVSVPRLRGLSARDSRFTLERSGLQLGSVDYDTSNVFPENTIISQSPQAGARVARGAAVRVVVSRGQVLRQVMFPELAGRSLAEAEKLLAQKMLKLGNITYQPSFELLPNTVVDQFPRGGELVPEGRAVDLFVVRVGKPREEIQKPYH